MNFKGAAGLAAILFLTIGCAGNQRHRANAGRHHHYTKCDDKKCETKVKVCRKENCSLGSCQMYKKHCAYSVSRGEMDVKGKSEYSLKHEGHNYYFSSKKKMEKFRENLEENVEKANENWDAFKWRRIR